ncbi:hypothetical protein [Occultella glacieicola]|uniref:hypothetical protein n=1 Tax=Occultella glacieicola TaxID=2518684 RepID=UPI0014050D51|nr:hypothetical protein [Occultella glacieicola]
MAKGLNLEFVADVRRFIAGTDDIERSLDEVSDSLDTMARDADRAGDKVSDSLEQVGDDAKDAGRDLERGLEDGTDAAADEATRLERTFKDTFDTVKRESKGAGDDVSRNTKRGMDDAADSTETFKNEARQNLSESVSSFRGDVEDIPQLVQDVFGGVAADLGPAGLIGGTLVAAGIGLGVAYLQGAAEKAEELKDHTIDLAKQIQEVGGDLNRLDLGAIFDDWAFAIGDTKEFWEVWQNAPITNVEQMATAMDALGVSATDMYAALTDPNGPEGQRILEQIIDTLANTGGMSDETTNALVHMRDAIRDGNLSLEDATELQQTYQAAIEGTTVEAIKAREAEEELREERETSRDVLFGLNDATAGYYEALQAANEALSENGAGLNLATERGRENQAALDAQAQASYDYIQALIDSGAAEDDVTTAVDQHRAALREQATQMGMTETQAQTYIDTILGTPSNINTTFNVTDNGTAAATEQRINNIPSSLRVPVNVDGAGLQGQLDEQLRRLRVNAIQAPLRIGTRVA